MRTELRMPRLPEIPVGLKSTPVLGREVFIRSTAFIILGASLKLRLELGAPALELTMCPPSACVWGVATGRTELPVDSQFSSHIRNLGGIGYFLFKIGTQKVLGHRVRIFE